jgi:hypothetical protein
MTSEEIRIASLPGMQAFFSEKMGESRERDHFHCLTCGVGGLSWGGCDGTRQ